MKQKADISFPEAIAQESGELAKLTLNYGWLMKQILDSAKTDPGFSVASWAPLAEMVDVARFKRVGTFLEVVEWSEYARLLTDWSIMAYWEPRVRRVTEQEGLVFLELAEQTTYKGMADKVEKIHSVSVYEYDQGNKLVHLDVYMQRMLKDFPKGSWDV